MIRVVLPYHLRTLARVEGDVQLEVAEPITLRSVLDALEARYPVLRGTIRDHDTLEAPAVHSLLRLQGRPVSRIARNQLAGRGRERRRAVPDCGGDGGRLARIAKDSSRCGTSQGGFPNGRSGRGSENRWILFPICFLMALYELKES